MPKPVRRSVVDQILAAIDNDGEVQDALIKLATSATEGDCRAKQIRLAILPVRADIAVSCIHNSEFYQAFGEFIADNNILSNNTGATMANTINTNTPVQNITFVYGQDVALMDKNALIAAIGRAKADVKKYQDVGVDSTFIAGEVAALTAAIDTMVKLLDK